VIAIKERVVVITGGASGIGKELVVRFSNEGKKVITLEYLVNKKSLVAKF